MKAHSLVLVSLAAFGTLPVQAANSCKLQKYADLPVTMSGTQPLVEGTINGEKLLFLTDSGAFWNTLSRQAAEQLKLKLGPLPMKIQGVSGQDANPRLAAAKDFTLTGYEGGRVIHNAAFVVTGNSTWARGIAGLIGENLLGDGDTEYDLANGMIRLFQAKDCTGAMLAYWHGNADVGIVDVE